MLKIYQKVITKNMTDKNAVENINKIQRVSKIEKNIKKKIKNFYSVENKKITGIK